jgi:peptidoglycan/LPS O-acetylase OafA/YrhL
MSHSKAPAKSAHKHMPGLDALRGVAILLVAFYHGFAFHRGDAGLPAIGQHFCALMEYGRLGVHLFFVLSGFLISGILLDSRANGDYYRRFYFRRVLRILPAYLLMVAVLRITHSISWRFTLVSLLYLCNLSSLLHARPEYGSFWSLSVEEQFYLVWPTLIRRVSRRTLFVLSALIILASPWLRLALLHGPAFTSDIHFKTWAVGDFFAAGTLLALMVRSTRWGRRELWLAVGIALAAGLLLCFLINLLPHNGLDAGSLPYQAWLLTPWVFLFSALLLAGFLAPVISAGPGRLLVFFGNISYGLYLVHHFIFGVIDRHFGFFLSHTGSRFQAIWLEFAVELSLSVAIAFVSRWTYEEYFLRLKSRRKKAPVQSIAA